MEKHFFLLLMHTLQWLQLAATTMVGLQAPARSLVAYQSRHPVHFHGNVFMNFVKNGPLASAGLMVAKAVCVQVAH